MAAKMICPNCNEVLSQYGDDDKGDKFYRVYDSLWNPKEKPGKHRAIECMCCSFIGQVGEWE